MPFEPFHDRLFVTPLLPFEGLGTETVDEDGYRALLRRFLTPEYIEAGISIIANPEAGEIFCLSRQEKKRVVEITLEEVAGRTPVLAGASWAGR